MLLAVRLVNCHVIGCKTRNRLIGVFRSVYYSGQSTVSQLSVLVSLISCLQGAGSCWHRFSGICSKLVNQLSRVSRW